VNRDQHEEEYIWVLPVLTDAMGLLSMDAMGLLSVDAMGLLSVDAMDVVDFVLYSFIPPWVYKILQTVIPVIPRFDISSLFDL